MKVQRHCDGASRRQAVRHLTRADLFPDPARLRWHCRHLALILRWVILAEETPLFNDAPVGKVAQSVHAFFIPDHLQPTAF